MINPNGRSSVSTSSFIQA